MSEGNVIKIGKAQISNNCVITLEYFQSSDNHVLKNDILMLKNLLLYLAVPDPEAMIPQAERIELIKELSTFIIMIRDLKAKEE